MGNNKLEFITFEKPVQYGLKAASFEVETAPNISDNFSIRIDVSQEVDLPLKIIFLFDT